MPTGLTWTGVSALIAALRGEPEYDKAGARRDAEAAAATQVRAITSVYQAHRRTGALAGSVSVSPASIASVAIRVRASAPHAKYFEFGTRRSDAFGVFVPAAISSRRAFIEAGERRVQAPRLLG